MFIVFSIGLLFQPPPALWLWSLNRKEKENQLDILPIQSFMHVSLWCYLHHSWENLIYPGVFKFHPRFLLRTFCHIHIYMLPFELLKAVPQPYWWDFFTFHWFRMHPFTLCLLLFSYGALARWSPLWLAEATRRIDCPCWISRPR